MSMTKAYLDVDGVQLHYRIGGDPSGTPVVLLHQVPSSSAMWTAVFAPFIAQGYRVIAFDLPGYGMSDPLTPEPGVSELTDYADILSKAFVALELGPVFLVGHHTGASVSMQLTASHPEVVRAAAVWGVPALEHDHAVELATEQPPVYGPEYGEDVLNWFIGRMKWTQPDQVADVMPRSLIELVESGLHRPDGHNAVGRAGDHAAIITAMTRPVLAMTGNREMLDGDTRKAVALYPDRLVLADLGDAGMDIADEDPQRFVDTVHAFFASTPSVDA